MTHDQRLGESRGVWFIILRFKKQPQDFILIKMTALRFAFLSTAFHVLTMTASFAHAGEVVLARYHDCANARNALSDMLPVFTKIRGREIPNSYTAGEYLNGLDIKAVTNSDGSIASFQIGDQMPLTARDLEQGLEFGVGPVTAHTVQLTNFNPERGGTLEFGHLKSMRLTGEDGGEKKNLNEFYQRRFGDNWGTYKLRISKDRKTQQWRITEMDGHPVNKVFGILKARAFGLVVTGIPSMVSIQQDLNCPNPPMVRISDDIIEIKKNGETFQCAIPKSADKTPLPTRAVPAIQADDRVYIDIP